MRIFDHETTLEPGHWHEFLAWEKEEFGRDQKLLKYLTGGFAVGLLIVGLFLKDSALVFASATGCILLWIVYLVARAINKYSADRFSRANPVVKRNSVGYQIGESFRPWPFGLSIINAVVVNERPN